MSYYPSGNAWQNPGIGPGGGYEEFGAQPGMQRPAAGPSGSNPFNMFSGATSAMAQHGLAAYGGKFLGSGREYVQSNISKLGNMHYYFQVNSQYVKNKLKILLFPFLHKGHWTRITEQVGGDKLTFKPPNEDINAPDLYLPVMAFGTYMILCGIFLGMKGQFGPEVLSSRCTRGLVAWGAQILLMRSILYTLGSGNSPLLDIIAYTGYSFVGVSINILARMGSLWVYYGVLAWTTISLDVFLVRTLKRILFAEARSYDRDSSRHHYMLLLIALFQFPVAIGLGLL